ncbi:hypothetical protein [Polaromonas sp.]|uniref:hypothetical protein n=1 Tax=Polaromonas sp. TaxID=1869339 RepID=UPI0025DC4E9B|nr:hypothetical protein [Polaromonas sp.]
MPEFRRRLAGPALENPHVACPVLKAGGFGHLLAGRRVHRSCSTARRISFFSACKDATSSFNCRDRVRDERAFMEARTSRPLTEDWVAGWLGFIRDAYRVAGPGRGSHCIA